MVLDCTYQYGVQRACSARGLSWSRHFEPDWCDCNHVHNYDWSYAIALSLTFQHKPVFDSRVTFIVED